MWTSALKRIAARRCVILGYHGIGQTNPGEDLFRLVVSSDQFTRQLELVVAAGFRFVTVTELADRLHEDQQPSGLAAISFDDGMRDNYVTALPILRRFGIPATVYVVAGLVGSRTPWISSGPHGEMLREHEIRALAQEGWEVGAHTMTHADLSRLGYAACREEIESSRAMLEQMVGDEITSFAYPFGRYGEAALAAVRDLGFKAAVTTGSGLWSRLELTRAMVSGGDPLLVWMLKLTDRYEPALRNPILRNVRTVSKRARAMVHGGFDAQGTAGPPAY
jgi:O-antigen biosynthesis protein